MSGEIRAVREEIGRSSARATTLGAESSERASLRAELASGIEQAAAALRELEAGHASAQASIESLQTELSLKREDLEAARVEITDQNFGDYAKAMEGELDKDITAAKELGKKK